MNALSCIGALHDGLPFSFYILYLFMDIFIFFRLIEKTKIRPGVVITEGYWDVRKIQCTNDIPNRKVNYTEVTWSDRTNNRTAVVVMTTAENTDICFHITLRITLCTLICNNLWNTIYFKFIFTSFSVAIPDFTRANLELALISLFNSMAKRRRSKGETEEDEKQCKLFKTLSYTRLTFSPSFLKAPLDKCLLVAGVILCTCAYVSMARRSKHIGSTVSDFSAFGMRVTPRRNNTDLIMILIHLSAKRERQDVEMEEEKDEGAEEVREDEKNTVLDPSVPNTRAAGNPASGTGVTSTRDGKRKGRRSLEARQARNARYKAKIEMKYGTTRANKPGPSRLVTEETPLPTSTVYVERHNGCMMEEERRQLLLELAIAIADTPETTGKLDTQGVILRDGRIEIPCRDARTLVQVQNLLRGVDIVTTEGLIVGSKATVAKKRYKFYASGYMAKMPVEKLIRLLVRQNPGIKETGMTYVSSTPSQGSGGRSLTVFVDLTEEVEGRLRRVDFTLSALTQAVRLEPVTRVPPPRSGTGPRPHGQGPRGGPPPRK